MTADDLVRQYRLARDGAVAFELERDVVSVTGPDARSFLDSLLSQRIDDLEVGSARWSFLLQPQGKAVALFRVWHRSDLEFVLDTDPGIGSRLVTGLDRFLLRTEASIDQLEGWRCIALRGPAVEVPDLLPPLAGEGGDLLGPDVEVPHGVPLGDSPVYEVVRMEDGVPVTGAEVTETTIPQEVGITDRTVDFTKGCYLGQELVARIDSRGHVNRHLRLIRSSDPLVPAEELLDSEGSVRGEITSAAIHPDRTHWVGMAIVRREIEPGSTMSRPGDHALVQVEALPAP